MSAETDIRIGALETAQAVTDERIRSMDKALELQAREYDRRLDDLNHAHAQAVEVQNTYVTEEVHERDMAAAAAQRKNVETSAEAKAEALDRALVEAKQSSDERFGRIESFQAKLVGALALAAVFVPLLTAVVVYILTKGK